MLAVAHVNESVVADPAIGMNGRFWVDVTAHDGLQGAFLEVRDNLGVDASLAPRGDAENNGFAAGPAPSFATNALGAEVAFVDLDFAVAGERAALTGFGESASDFKKNRASRAAREARQFGGVGYREVERGFFGPIGASQVPERFFHLATVFGFR